MIPRRSASSSVSRCTSASGRARRISLASSSPTATSSIAALRTPLIDDACRCRVSSISVSNSAKICSFQFRCPIVLCSFNPRHAFSVLLVRSWYVLNSEECPSIGMNPALQQPRTLRRLTFQVTANLFEDLLRSGAFRGRAGGLRRIERGSGCLGCQFAQSLLLPESRARRLSCARAILQCRTHTKGQHHQQARQQRACT